MKQILVLAVLVCGACAISVHEAKKFHNSGTYGGTVTYKDNGDGTITLTSNGLPDHPFERVNPNHPETRSDVYTLPKNPTFAKSVGCLAMGPIGMTITGSMIYDPLDADGENAVEGSGRERFDHYGGHTDNHGIYHYHKIPGSWMYTGEADELLGVAFDGFPIYGPKASDLGRDVTNKDLDKCHGRMVNGKYRYHVNTEFPYYLGCYKGNPTHANHVRTQHGICTNTSSLPEYGYVCACPRGQHPPPQGHGTGVSGNHHHHLGGLFGR
ncbi:uncharacterized protein LOC132548746 [Ylistrum balloti]|uniref:uncharacterized protein LOC132548746 n=1 Tax=Ylistrum balloti TaxID=509963 RepID=UPI0029058FD8|nr:uncharacterized protein LOC132548746 [Ylistrum balloti]